jgi:transposase-like protein
MRQKRKGKNTPAAVREAVLAEASSGTRIVDLAKSHGIPARTIQNWVSEAGMTRDFNPGTKPKPDRDEMVRSILAYEDETNPALLLQRLGIDTKGHDDE